MTNITDATQAAQMYRKGAVIETTPPSRAHYRKGVLITGGCHAHQITAGLDLEIPDTWQRLLDLGYKLQGIRNDAA